MPSPILARADALMHRQRQSAGTDELPVLTDAITLPAVEDDIPVLLDVAVNAPQQPAQPTPPAAPPPAPTKAAPPQPFPSIDSEFLADPPPAAPAPKPPAKPSAPAAAVLAKLAASSREDIAHDIARRVELRLAAELPRLIAAAVRDYLAEQNAAPR